MNINFLIGTKAQFIKCIPVINEAIHRSHNVNLHDLKQHAQTTDALKVKIKAKNIEISVPKMTDADKVDPVRNGKVSFFDSSKGFGFIIDTENQEKYFTYVSGIIDQIAENDKVTFELEKGMKGMNAVKVTLKK